MVMHPLLRGCLARGPGASLLLVLAIITGIAAQPPAAQARDEEYRKAVVGVWQDHYQGKRTMTIRPDGTARMVVELSGAKAALFARKLVFEMKWSIQNGRLFKQTIGGEPKRKVALILRTMGDRVDEPILELSDQRLRLLDRDGKTEYNWRRLANTPPVS
jgi:hypothetical protein